MIYDAIVVGAGLAGSLSANLLTRGGYQVVLVDKDKVPPIEFRAEQVFGEQVHVLERLGLLDKLVRGASFTNHTIIGRRGRCLEEVDVPHYFLSYSHMVANARSSVPLACECVVDRVATIETDSTSKSVQHVRLVSGSSLKSRLVILATGFSRALHPALGIGRERVGATDSLAIGFCMTGPKLSGSMLVYSGEKTRDRVDYISIFPWGDRLRANLFLFKDVREPWVQEFRFCPRDKLLEVMPRLSRLLGNFEIEKRVQVRTNHLWRATNHFRDGVVLVGDAFQTPCPAAGIGISRLLVDVDRLCTVHFPRWIEREGFSSPSTTDFYLDPVKAASDASAIAAAEFRRNTSANPSLSWTLYRETASFYRRLRKPSPRQPTSAGGGVRNQG
jgi:2-polyprenyl-6-methoxyphenol hydroxylase-like FAD-dependent oxidoreductase